MITIVLGIFTNLILLQGHITEQTPLITKDLIIILAVTMLITGRVKVITIQTPIPLTILHKKDKIVGELKTNESR